MVDIFFFTLIFRGFLEEGRPLPKPVNFLISEYLISTNPRALSFNPSFGYISKGAEVYLLLSSFEETRRKKIYDYYGDFEGWVETASNKWYDFLIDVAGVYRLSFGFLGFVKNTEKTFKYRFLKEIYDEFRVKKEEIPFEQEGSISNYSIMFGTGYSLLLGGVSIDYVKLICNTQKSSGFSFSLGGSLLWEPYAVLGLSYKHKREGTNSLFNLSSCFLFPSTYPSLLEVNTSIDVWEKYLKELSINAQLYLNDYFSIFSGINARKAQAEENPENGFLCGLISKNKAFRHIISLLVTVQSLKGEDVYEGEKDESINNMNFYLGYSFIYEF